MIKVWSENPAVVDTYPQTKLDMTNSYITNGITILHISHMLSIYT